MIQDQVLPFIPQRPPFVMIDKVERADENVSVTSFTICEGHLFVENGVFTEPGLIENIAQTAAAGTGYKAQQENMPAPVGFIGALKGLQIKELPKVGETITTTISFLHQIMNAHIVQGIVRVEGREIASCELKIFLQIETQNT
ncbi:MAG TPA: 3-hydroxyacyl-ACP dehydratase [Flavipsychrobacter sp.]|nr:3-hydroxyacyl-ACP dehydratase [Flavipsychrobacter sp.]